MRGIVLVLAALLGVVPLSARAAEGEAAAGVAPGSEADRYYQLGMRHIAAEAWERAAVAFDEARARDGAVELVWNAARAWDKAGAATEARERYLAFMAHDAAPGELRRWAGARVKQLDADLAAARDRLDHAEEARIAARIAEELRAELARTAPAAPGPREFIVKPAAPPRGDGLALGGWITLGLGAGCLIAGGVLLGDAAAIDGRLASPRRDGSGVIVGYTPREAADLADTRDTEQAVGIAGLALGGGLLVASVVMLILAEDGSAPGDGVAVDVAPRRGGVVVGLGGSF